MPTDEIGRRYMQLGTACFTHHDRLLSYLNRHPSRYMITNEGTSIRFYMTDGEINRVRDIVNGQNNSGDNIEIVSRRYGNAVWQMLEEMRGVIMPDYSDIEGSRVIRDLLMSQMEEAGLSVRRDSEDVFQLGFDYITPDRVDYERYESIWHLPLHQLRNSPECCEMLDEWYGSVIREGRTEFLVEMSRDEHEIAEDYLDGDSNDAQAFVLMAKEVMGSGVPEVQITEDNVDHFFPKRFGVELEYELEEVPSYDTIHNILENEGLRVKGVKSDGSLSHAGFEIVSEKLDSLEEVENFMVRGKRRLVREGYELSAQSPTAIHIHVSNVKKPTNMFLVMRAFQDVFEHMRKKMKNGLVHEKLMLPQRGDLLRAMENGSYEDVSRSSMRRYKGMGIDPILDEENKNINHLFMLGRRSTLRYAGYDSGRKTLEFRVLPQRLHTDVYKIYVKIVDKLIEYAENMSFNDLYEMNEQKKYAPIHLQMMKFKDVCDLSNEELFKMFNSIKNDRTVLYEDLKLWEVCRYDAPLTKIPQHRWNFENYPQPLKMVLGEETGFNLSKMLITIGQNELRDVVQNVVNSFEDLSDMFSSYTYYLDGPEPSFRRSGEVILPNPELSIPDNWITLDDPLRRRVRFTNNDVVCYITYETLRRMNNPQLDIHLEATYVENHVTTLDDISDRPFYRDGDVVF